MNGQSHENCSEAKHNFWRERWVDEGDSNQGSYQPSSLPLGQTDSHPELSNTTLFRMPLFPQRERERDRERERERAVNKTVHDYHTSCRMFLLFSINLERKLWRWGGMGDGASKCLRVTPVHNLLRHSTGGNKTRVNIVCHWLKSEKWYWFFQRVGRREREVLVLDTSKVRGLSS